MAQRPFTDREDLRKRVNKGLAPQRCLGAKAAERLRVGAEQRRARNAEYARELLGLTVYVPCSAWGSEYDDGSEVAGTVWRYTAEHFEVRFPLRAESEPVSLSWAELFGEQPCLESGTDRARLIWPRVATRLTPQPRARVPRSGNAVWDQRAGAWFGEDGERIDEVARCGEQPASTPHIARARPACMLVLLTLHVLLQMSVTRSTR